MTFEEYWILVLLVSTRIGAFLFLMPIFRGQSIPFLAKGSLVFAIAFIVAPQLEAVDVHTLPGLLGLILIEVLMGALLAFVIEIIVGIVRFAGAIIDMDIGLATSPAFDPTAGGVSTMISKVFYGFFLAIFVGMGGVGFFVNGIISTFQFQIPDGGWRMESMVSWLVDLVNYMFIGAVQIAFPFMFATFLVNLCLMLMGKSVDKINIFLNMFGIKILVGITLVALSVPALTIVFQQLYESMESEWMTAVRLLFT